jgi:integrase
MRFTGKIAFLEKHGSPYARGNYVKDGKRKQVWRKVVTTKAAARAEVIAEIERILNDEESETRTFSDLAAYYKKTRAIPAEFVHDEKVRGTKTHRQLAHVIDQLGAYFADTELRRITRDVVQGYRVAILNKPVRRRDEKGAAVYRTRSVASVNQHLRILRAMLNVAKQERWLDEVPSFKGLISSAAEAKREDMPTAEEFRRILDACDARQRLNHVKPIVLMVADTGARPTELWHLKWEDLDLENRNVTLTSDKGVRRTRRTIPLLRWPSGIISTASTRPYEV